MSTNAVSNQPRQTITANGKGIQRLDSLTNWLLGLIVAIPFFISFGTLKALAAENGISYPILYPLMIDGGLIIFKLLALRESLRGKRDTYTWGMAISLTVISVVLNILHVPAEIHSIWLARFMAALPPLVILGSFIAVSRRIEEGARLEGAVLQYEQIVELAERKKHELSELVKNRTAELDAIVQQRTAEIEQLTTKIERLTVQKEDLQTEIRTLKTEQKSSSLGKLDARQSNLDDELNDNLDIANAIRASKKEEAMDALLRFLDANPDATLSDIAEQIGRSKSTVGNYVNELTNNGRLHKNGHGWEVLQ